MTQAIGVRDTKARQRGYLAVPRAAWAAFTNAAAQDVLPR